MYRNIIIVILVGVVFLMLNSNKGFIPTIITKTDTIYKTNTTKVYKKGADIYHKQTDSFYSHITDTIKFVIENNVATNYKDTIKLDANSFIINDTIANNKIQGRGFTANIEEKTITIKETIQAKPKNGLYIGFLGDLRQDKTLESVGVGMIYKLKDKALIGVSVNTNKRLGVSIFFKL